MAEAADNSTNTISLKTASGEIFNISPATAKRMPTIQSILDSDPSAASSAIPLPTVNSSELSVIIDYIRRKAAAAAASTNATLAKEEFDEKFEKELSPDQLTNLLNATDHLKVCDMQDVVSSATAKFIENKSVEFVRKFFGIVTDFTPAYDAKFREENAWVFEGVEED